MSAKIIKLTGGLISIDPRNRHDDQHDDDDDHNGDDCDGGDLLVPDDVLQHHELEGVVVAPALVTAQQHAGELS